LARRWYRRMSSWFTGRSAPNINLGFMRSNDFIHSLVSPVSMALYFPGAAGISTRHPVRQR
jgi:hypothetical protein